MTPPPPKKCNNNNYLLIFEPLKSGIKAVSILIDIIHYIMMVIPTKVQYSVIVKIEDYWLKESTNWCKRTMNRKLQSIITSGKVKDIFS